MINILNPFTGIGDFELNKSISKYSNKFYLIKDDYDAITNWTTYYVDDHDIILFTEKESIVSIKCKEQCIFNNVNLIKSSINVFKTMNIHANFDEEVYIDDFEIQKVYYVDLLGIQCWTNENDLILGIII